MKHLNWFCGPLWPVYIQLWNEYSYRDMIAVVVWAELHSKIYIFLQLSSTIYIWMPKWSYTSVKPLLDPIGSQCIGEILCLSVCQSVCGFLVPPIWPIYSKSPRSNQINPSEPKWTHVNPSEPSQVNSGKFR